MSGTATPSRIFKKQTFKTGFCLSSFYSFSRYNFVPHSCSLLTDKIFYAKEILRINILHKHNSFLLHPSYKQESLLQKLDCFLNDFNKMWFS